MSDIKQYHRKAMDVADDARIARARGQNEQAALLFRRAFEAEKEAAYLCIDKFDFEPTRSVLCRSAAVLALECGETRAAEQLIAWGLVGNPPADIAEELRDLLEQVSFDRHLALRGIVLDPQELRLSIAGKEVGFGIVQSDEFVSRVQAFEKLILRTGERRAGYPYRETGGPHKEVRENLEIYMASPTAASFAVSMRIGRPIRQPLLFEDKLNPCQVVDAVVEGLEILIGSGNDALSDLHSMIPDDAYFRNFVSLARKIAPNRGVHLVGITVIRGSSHKDLALTLPKQKMPSIRPQDAQAQEITVTGVLLYADRTGGRNGKIKVVEPDTKIEHLIQVPEGMMTDIVKPLWENLVTVRGHMTKDVIHLEDIDDASMPESRPEMLPR